MHVAVVRPEPKHYRWGSTSEIPRLLNYPNPEGKAIAELWYGTHPDGPAGLRDSEGTLLQLIESDPELYLGQALVERYGSQLPFLLKVLSAAQPLSLQVHPSKAQAEEGFDREERAGTAIDAGNRNYRDRNHKPEMLLALTTMRAMVGFRPPNQILSLLEPLRAAFPAPVDQLKGQSEQDFLRSLLDSVFALNDSELKKIPNEARRAAVVAQDAGAVMRFETYCLMSELAESYPGDPGILSPLYLNIVRLEPGQALYLPAGILHAYLEGTGIEIMAASNNVLRGGLTAKHVDREELRKVLEFRSYQPPLLGSTAAHELKEDGESRVTEYDTPFEEFHLSRIDVSAEACGMSRSSNADMGPEILLCTHGQLECRFLGQHPESTTLAPSEAIFIPAGGDAYQLRGPACVYRATVGHNRISADGQGSETQ